MDNFMSIPTNYEYWYCTRNMFNSVIAKVLPNNNKKWLISLRREGHIEEWNDDNNRPFCVHNGGEWDYELITKEKANEICKKWWKEWKEAKEGIKTNES